MQLSTNEAPQTSTSRQFTRKEREEIAGFSDFYKAVYGCRPHHLDVASDEKILQASQALHRKFEEMESAPLTRKQLREDGWTIPEPVYNLGPKDLFWSKERSYDPKKLMRPCKVTITRDLLIRLGKELLGMRPEDALSIDHNGRAFIFNGGNLVVPVSKLRAKIAHRLRQNLWRAGAALKGFRWIMEGADTCQLEVNLVPAKRYRYD